MHHESWHAREIVVVTHGIGSSQKTLVTRPQDTADKERDGLGISYVQDLFFLSFSLPPCGTTAGPKWQWRADVSKEHVMTWQEAAPALNLSTTALFPCDLALHVYHVTLEFAYFKVSVRRLSHHKTEHANKSKKDIQKNK